MRRLTLRQKRTVNLEILMQRVSASLLRAPFATACCLLVSILVGNITVSDLAAAEERAPSADDIAATAPMQPLPNDGELGEEDDGAGNIIVYQANRPTGLEPSPMANPKDPATADYAYLVQTAVSGGTMARQGPELAIGRLHPEFVHRLAAAIQEVRQAGLPNAGIFSAYRPPAFGVGGFSDKFNSLHTYGLAVDMTGIGGPGTAEAKLWHEIAAQHGVACPYGFANPVEWNHCQPTRIKIILSTNPLRQTVTADGPIDLKNMFAVGDRSIESSDAVLNDFLSSGSADLDGTRAGDDKSIVSGTDNGIPRNENFAHLVKQPPSWCKALHHPSKETCGSSHQVETAAKTQSIHPKQASILNRHHS
jgi:hypothetical protein